MGKNPFKVCQTNIFPLELKSNTQREWETQMCVHVALHMHGTVKRICISLHGPLFLEAWLPLVIMRYVGMLGDSPSPQSL